ncbi:MAG: DUF1810 domain-containing protein [Paramuribaculum sp.]|nr:DUF1810 domain-containing protein [Paramuribaculum sp.]
MVKLRHSEWKLDKANDISRFIKAQENMYDTALAEIRNGRKESHWIWFILPQLRGLGHSFNSNYYGLDGLEEARLYLNNPILNAHLREIVGVLLSLPINNPESIFGKLDALKLKSSMTLFDAAQPNDIYAKVLKK